MSPTHPTHWTKYIKVGDVLRSGSGVLRVVRAVHSCRVDDGYGRSHTRETFTFSIRKCSWTHRCYTSYNGNDLVQMGYRPTGTHVKLNKKIDRVIQAEFGKRERGLSCCDVVGVA
jgi:hypothetical protein